ncbi:MAG TPA: hypothetical protein VHB45_10505 [Alloacidobacterium sp.]|nr:hypothetical protein [Alloacidobacterium sp.]
MTTEQLQAVRAEKWRQKANPLLTIEEAEAWIDSTGISLFLPRKNQLQIPAPSFVEAVLGETSATPAPDAIQNAFEMATRLFSDQKATPLNLLGNVSEQPDFLASREALPYVFALRGDRDWKRGPREKSSPLVIESWKLLKREGALTVSELQNLLGREVTEAAVLRALCELWGAMRVLPIYSEGEDTAWEVFESRDQKAMQAGGGMGQGTALSALISLYLDAVVAATSDEIETFLSPLAPRSRIREVVHGLTTTRQLLTIPQGTQTLVHIAGGLPEFPEIEPTPEQAAEAAPQMEAPRARRTFTRPGSEDRGQRPAAEGGWTRPAADRSRREWTPRSDQSGRPPRKEWKPRREGEERREFRPRREEGESTERRSFKPRTPGEFRPRREEGGFKKPFRRREEGESRGAGFSRGEGSGFKPRSQGGFRPREEGSESAKKPFGSRTVDRRSGGRFFQREGGDTRPPRKEWKPRREEGESTERRSFKPGAGKPRAGGFRPRREDSGPGGKKPFNRTGDRRFGSKFSPREGGDARPTRKEWKPRREGEERREGGKSTERRSFKPRTPGEFRPRREGGFSGKSESGRGRSGFDHKKPPQRASRPAGEGSDRPKKSFSRSGPKPGGRSFGGSKKSNGGKSSFGSKRPGFGARRPGSKPSSGKRPNYRKGKKSGE